MPAAGATYIPGTYEATAATDPEPEAAPETAELADSQAARAPAVTLLMAAAAAIFRKPLREILFILNPFLSLLGCVYFNGAGWCTSAGPCQTSPPVLLPGGTII